MPSAPIATNVNTPLATFVFPSPSRSRATPSAEMVSEVRPCLNTSTNTDNSSPTAIAPGKRSSSAATTTHLPRATRDARLPAASAIWLINHPPNTPP